MVVDDNARERIMEEWEWIPFSPYVRIMPLLANNEFSSFFIYLIFMALFLCSLFHFSFTCSLFLYKNVYIVRAIVDALLRLMIILFKKPFTHSMRVLIDSHLHPSTPPLSVSSFSLCHLQLIPNGKLNNRNDNIKIYHSFHEIHCRHRHSHAIWQIVVSYWVWLSV